MHMRDNKACRKTKRAPPQIEEKRRRNRANTYEKSKWMRRVGWAVSKKFWKPVFSTNQYAVSSVPVSKSFADPPSVTDSTRSAHEKTATVNTSRAQLLQSLHGTQPHYYSQRNPASSLHQAAVTSPSSVTLPSIVISPSLQEVLFPPAFQLQNDFQNFQSQSLTPLNAFSVPSLFMIIHPLLQQIMHFWGAQNIPLDAASTSPYIIE